MKRLLISTIMVILVASTLFGFLGIAIYLSEPVIDWEGVLIGVIWSLVSLWLLQKTIKQRATNSSQKESDTSSNSDSQSYRTPTTKENVSMQCAPTLNAPFTTTPNRSHPVSTVWNSSPSHNAVIKRNPRISPKQPDHTEKIEIKATDLDFRSVIQRYLTTSHSKIPAVYDYYSYHHAEFECILSNIPRATIQLSNERVLRGKELLSPFEQTAPLNKHVAKTEVSNFIVIDTETTGLRTGGNDIIEISAIRFENFVPVSAFTTLLKPRNPIPPEATRINGITDEMVQYAPTFAQIRNSLSEFIGNYPIVAHNAKFDIKFLHVSGLVFPTETKFYDTLELSRLHIREYDGTKLDNYKLKNVCDTCCIFFLGAHRSMTDALATGLLFIEIIKAIHDVDDITAIDFPTKPITNTTELEGWDYYQTQKPLKTFSVTDRSEDAFAGYYSIGDEIEQGFDSEKDITTLEINYGTICRIPRTIQTFFDENLGSYRMFVLDAYEDNNGNVKIKIGIFAEK